MTEDLKNWFSNKVEEIISSVKTNDETAAVAESTGNVEVEVTIVDEEEVASKLSSFEASVESLNSTIVNLEEEMTSTKGANETLTEEVSSLQAKLNKSDAIGTKVDTDGDPTVIKKTVVQDANAGFYNVLVDRIQTRFIN